MVKCLVNIEYYTHNIVAYLSYIFLNNGYNEVITRENEKYNF